MREAVATRLDGITRYHDHVKQKPFGFLVRPAVLIIGWFVVLIGIIAIPLPGPGWLIVFIGVAILSHIWFSTGIVDVPNSIIDKDVLIGASFPNFKYYKKCIYNISPK